MVTTVVCTDRAACPATASAARVVAHVVSADTALGIAAAAGTASCASVAVVVVVVAAGSADASAVVATFGPGQARTPSAVASSAALEDAY